MSILLTTHWAEGVTGPPHHQTQTRPRSEILPHTMCPQDREPKRIGNDDHNKYVFNDMISALQTFML